MDKKKVQISNIAERAGELYGTLTHVIQGKKESAKLLLLEKSGSALGNTIFALTLAFFAFFLIQSILIILFLGLADLLDSYIIAASFITLFLMLVILSIILLRKQIFLGPIFKKILRNLEKNNYTHE